MAKNIINFPIDFAKIPVSEKKFLYIHNDIYRGKPINPETNAEKLVEITNDEIRSEPFWEDEVVLTGNKEIDDLIALEGREMDEYIRQNGGKFGIFVRESVKEKLLKIEANFRKKWYFLALKIGYRPLQVQKNLFEKILAFYTAKNPNASEKEIYEMTTEMISNPTRDVSPHTTGAAIDVVLYRANGELVDMGCPVNFIGEKANLTTTDISDEQRKNREILQDEFLAEGFSVLSSEWWHFAYGDPYWSAFYGEKMARYDATNL